MTFKPLNERLIHRHLQYLAIKQDVEIHVLTEIDSTNRFLKDLQAKNKLRIPPLTICVAESQTQGRGRFGRHWISPFGENIYLSCRLKLPANLTKLSGLALITSIAIVKTLSDRVSKLKIKWPNDILWTHKKLGGILIETIGKAHHSTEVIIGIGLNINTDTMAYPLADNPWCSLYEITGYFIDRNPLIAELVISIMYHIDKFLKHGMVLFHDEWQSLDYLRGRYLTVTEAHRKISGYAQGITHEGHLRLVDNEGHEHHLSAGETSLKS